MNFKHVNSALHSPFFNKKVNFFKLGNGIDRYCVKCHDDFVVGIQYTMYRYFQSVHLTVKINFFMTLAIITYKTKESD